MASQFWTVAATILVAMLPPFDAASVNTSANRDWDLILRDGDSSNEGTLLVRFSATWGLLCDDGWDSRGADVACRQLGFGQSLEYSVTNKYNTRLDGLQVVLDDVQCTGREGRLSECRSRPLGRHNCQPREAAGVRCSVLGEAVSAAPATTDGNPLRLAGVDARKLKDLVKPVYKLRQIKSNSSNIDNGSIIAIVGGVAGGVCPDRITLREGNVLCRELGLGFAKSIWKHPLSEPHLNSSGQAPSRTVLTVGNCRGSERQLSQCVLYGSGQLGSPCSTEGLTIGVNCGRDLPDLVPDVRALQSSAYITRIPLFHMTCAMEENCASPIAFEIRKNSQYWQFASRTLLRFSTIVANHGAGDFVPISSAENWTWHSCHMHFHSMAYFAAYQVYLKHNTTHRTVASGHKASFCLEDNACKPGVSPRYRCSQDPMETGTQGITAGCSDNYLHDLDCQWIDITDIPYGFYQFRMAINPEFLAPELSFDNNAVVCHMVYSPTEVQLYSCRLIHPFDF